MDTILIRDLTVSAIIGIEPHERVHKQPVVINITLWGDTRPAAVSNEIADAINYATIVDAVRAYVENSAEFLVERMAANIARTCLDSQPRVDKVRVRVEKPAAIADVRAVGVEITRTRTDFAA